MNGRYLSCIYFPLIFLNLKISGNLPYIIISDTFTGNVRALELKYMLAYFVRKATFVGENKFQR